MDDMDAEQLDDIMRRLCCGGRCMAGDDPDEQGICSRFGYRAEAEGIAAAGRAEALAMLDRIRG